MVDLIHHERLLLQCCLSAGCYSLWVFIVGFFLWGGGLDFSGSTQWITVICMNQVVWQSFMKKKCYKKQNKKGEKQMKG